MGKPRTQAPSAAELLAHPVVQEALNRAWNDSSPDDPVERHEAGGWIYLNLKSGEIHVRRARDGAQASIDLSNPPVVSDCLVVGKFHTHPNPTAEGWNPAPSRADEIIDARHGVPDLIKADDGVYVSGPDKRRGGRHGNPGYPA